DHCRRSPSSPRVEVPSRTMGVEPEEQAGASRSLVAPSTSTCRPPPPSTLASSTRCSLSTGRASGTPTPEPTSRGGSLSSPSRPPVPRWPPSSPRTPRRSSLPWAPPNLTTSSASMSPTSLSAPMASSTSTN
ncbi:unnamed protein product, partial [Musa banksii]